MNFRNMGRFRITERLIKNDPDAVAKIFSMLKIVPLDVRYLADANSYEYLAIGERFELLPVGCIAPEYTFLFETGGNGDIQVVEVRKVS